MRSLLFLEEIKNILEKIESFIYATFLSLSALYNSSRK